jgi:hypothetical protein
VIDDKDDCDQLARMFEDRADRRKARRESSNKTIGHIVRGEHRDALREMGLVDSPESGMAGAKQNYDTSDAEETVRKAIDGAADVVAMLADNMKSVYPGEVLTERDLALLRSMVEIKMLDRWEKPLSDFSDEAEWAIRQMPILERRTANRQRLNQADQERVSRLRFILDG